jgi:hypothetical protein
MISKSSFVYLSLLVCLTLVACGDRAIQQPPNNSQNKTSQISNQLNNGKYPIQQASYEDGNGEYNLILLNTPDGVSSLYRTSNLQMVRLTDAEIRAGEQTYLELTDRRAVMHLTQNFKIEYLHKVVENRYNPETETTETIIIRSESGFWAPFAGALTGQVLGKAIFTPQYYVPPVYRPGRVITGYGGYGTSYNQAVASYRKRYKTVPAVEKNRQIVRTSGSLSKKLATKKQRTPTSTSSRNQPTSFERHSQNSNSTKTKLTRNKRSSFGSSSSNSNTANNKVTRQQNSARNKNSSNSNTANNKVIRQQNSRQNKGTGSGVSSTNLKSSNKSTSVKRTPSFGSTKSRSSSKQSSFGSSKKKR